MFMQAVFLLLPNIIHIVVQAWFEPVFFVFDNRTEDWVTGFAAAFVTGLVAAFAEDCLAGFVAGFAAFAVWVAVFADAFPARVFAAFADGFPVLVAVLD